MHIERLFECTFPKDIIIQKSVYPERNIPERYLIFDVNCLATAFHDL